MAFWVLTFPVLEIQISVLYFKLPNYTHKYLCITFLPLSQRKPFYAATSYSHLEVWYFENLILEGQCGNQNSTERYSHIFYFLIFCWTQKYFQGQTLFSCKDFHSIKENGLPHPSHLPFFIFPPSSPATHPWHRWTMYLHTFLHVCCLLLLLLFWLFGDFGFLGGCEGMKGNEFGLLGVFSSSIKFWLHSNLVVTKNCFKLTHIQCHG